MRVSRKAKQPLNVNACGKPSIPELQDHLSIDMVIIETSFYNVCCYITFEAVFYVISHLRCLRGYKNRVCFLDTCLHIDFSELFSKGA